MSKSAITHLVPAIQARLGAVKVVVHDRLEFMDVTVRAYTNETDAIQIDVSRVIVKRAASWEGLAEYIVGRFVAAGWKTPENEIESPEQKKMREEWSLEEEDTAEQRGDVSGEAEVYF